MMKKTHILGLAALLTLACGCSDFLDGDRNGILLQDDVAGVQHIDNLVTAAYASLGNDHYDTPLSLWCYGDVRSDDAYKGGRDVNDQQETHFFETASNIKTTFGLPDGLWYLCYVGISRANTALRALEAVDKAEFPLKEQRIGEMRFLRGHFHFLLKELFKRIPYIDHRIPTEGLEADGNDENARIIAYINSVSNHDCTDAELWQKIADDFLYAYQHLPETQAEVGRANRIAAAAYLARTKMFRAFRQDERNNVTNVDAADLEEVLTYTDVVLKSAYGLESDFAYNFLPEYENGREAIFSVQFTTGDGTKFGRLNFSDVLNAPQGIGGADFHKPSQNLVNAFRTENGLPMFDTFNASNYGYANNAPLDDYTRIADQHVDPRLYHTVAVPGMKFKYTYQTFEKGWNRNQSVYGIYASLKENVSPESDCFVKMPPFVANAKNRIVLRYADAVLLRAEALVELNRNLPEALDLINSLRQRAAASTGLIGQAANVDVRPYQPGVDGCELTQDYLRRAVRWERRLEFAMEGERFFHLVRWGVAADVVNAYYAKEKTLRSYLSSAHFDANKEEYIPVPQQQIAYSKDSYVQNYGWE